MILRNPLFLSHFSVIFPSTVSSNKFLLKRNIIIIIITHCYCLKQGLTLWPRLAFMDQPLGDDLSYVPPRPVSALLHGVVWCSCVCIFWHRCFSGCICVEPEISFVFETVTNFAYFAQNILIRPGLLAGSLREPAVSTSLH